MTKQDYRFETQRGHHIPITRYGGDAFGGRPCVLYIHGFKGFKDWGFVPFLGESMAEAGFDFVCFNFSHNGIGPDGQSYTELEAFSDNSFSLEVEETQEMIRMCAFSDFLGNHLRKPMGVLGHSRGGGIALLAAAASREVAAVATWAAVSTFERYPKADLDAWRKRGYHEVKNTRTGQILRLGKNLLKDVEVHAKSRLNILQAVQDLHKPLLILHGQADETVPYYEAEQLNVFANPHDAELRLIPNGTHTFGAKHPFETAPEPLQLAVQHSVDFFRQHLTQG